MHSSNNFILTNYSNQSNQTPKRIISLVPSLTELLYDLGLDEEVVGITKFCVHPNKWFRNKTRIGGTKNIDVEKIKLLQPDLVIANKEENVKEQVEAVSAFAPVWISDINNLDDALQTIDNIGVLTNKKLNAENITQTIKANFAQPATGNLQLSTCYLIWRNPYMTIGGDTFIQDMLSRCGLVNIFANNHRYPEITVQQIQEKNPQLVLLSSEPYPFKEKHIEELKFHLPDSKFLLVDGEMFSWYGSRLIKSPAYFQGLLKSVNQNQSISYYK
jgi:ABC-type Fe3+-hydroxamate transport system substrate-binding protein